MHTDDKRIASMAEETRELAARGHYPFQVQAVLKAYGFPEAAEWIDQPHIAVTPVCHPAEDRVLG